MSLREATRVTSEDVERLMQCVDRECRWADDVRFVATSRYFDVSGPAPHDFDAIRFETEAQEFRDALARNDISAVRDRRSSDAVRSFATAKPRENLFIETAGIELDSGLLGISRQSAFWHWL